MSGRGSNYIYDSLSVLISVSLDSVIMVKACHCQEKSLGVLSAVCIRVFVINTLLCTVVISLNYSEIKLFIIWTISCDHHL